MVLDAGVTMRIRQRQDEAVSNNPARFHTGEFEFRLALVAISFVVLSVLAATLVAAGAGQWVDGLRWALYLLASLTVASIVGLIFGVPRARAEFTASATERYSSNSNLEQISDWLTKLLVGAGLVQLASLPGLTASIGEYLGSGMAVSNAAAYSVSAVVLGAGTGFVFGYLWTRIRFRYLLEAAERTASEASKVEAVVVTLADASARNDNPATETELRAAVEAAMRSSKSLPSDASPQRILWVDDNPSNNASLREALRQVSVPVDLSPSTSDAMERLHKGQYGLVITDLGRVESRTEGEQPTYVADAGLELIRDIRSAGLRLPIFVYAGQRAMQRKDELLAAGASQVFDSAVSLFTGASQVALSR